jgi:hypothetical protein
VNMKDQQLETVRAAAERDLLDLRRRLLSVTEHNQVLQAARVNDPHAPQASQASNTELKNHLTASGAQRFLFCFEME